MKTTPDDRTVGQNEHDSAKDVTVEEDYLVLHRNTGITPHRLEGLSDAIYAVAMTLLVLDLRLPPNPSDTQLSSVLRHLLPNFITYALSFVTLGVLWTAHLIESHWVERISRTYVWLKIIYLMMVVLIPFSTQILSAYEYERLGVLFYGLNFLATMLLLLVLWKYATDDHRLVRTTLSSHVITWVKVRLIVANILVAVALIVALFFSSQIGAALFIVTQFLVIVPTASIDRLIIWLAPHLEHEGGTLTHTTKVRQ